MDKDILIKELQSLLSDFLKDQNMDLVDIIYRYEGRDLFLRVLADKTQGGINLDECAQLNRAISVILDERNILQERYVLEVSSPGLDRVLKTEKDFMRTLNKDVKVFLSEQTSGKLEWDGVVKNVDSNFVHLDIGQKVLEIPLNKINKAKRII
ncbi:MAG: ribosome maturation factor RimP [Candidatus Omnitrophica bacterium]|nr:ribosome maturation factor RimP [Candidatus Omnitrophota bacterium]